MFTGRCNTVEKHNYTMKKTKLLLQMLQYLLEKKLKLHERGRDKFMQEINRHAHA